MVEVRYCVDAHQHIAEYKRENTNLNQGWKGKRTFPGKSRFACQFRFLALLLLVKVHYKLAHKPYNQNSCLNTRKNQDWNDLCIILVATANHVCLRTEHVQCERR